MQDVAREIADLLEPTQPAGYRLVIVSKVSTHDRALLFEAKSIPLRGGTGFMIRMAENVRFGEKVPPVSDFRSLVAPTADAFKFLLREFYNLSTLMVGKRMMLVPPGVEGCNGEEVNLGSSSYIPLDDPDSFQERALDETIAALTLMRLPVGLAWCE
jgi:hypothetical protein